MDDSFDRLFIFNQESSQYYQDSAINFLVENSHLKDQLIESNRRIQLITMERDILKEKLNERVDLTYQHLEMIAIEKENVNEYEQKIAELSKSLQQKDMVINTLRSLINSTRIRPQDLDHHVNSLTSKINIEIEKYNKVKMFENIDSFIAEVRELFNYSLAELNCLNARNRIVTETLQRLQHLDNCEKTLKKIKHEMTKPQNLKITKSTS